MAYFLQQTADNSQQPDSVVMTPADTATVRYKVVTLPANPADYGEFEETHLDRANYADTIPAPVDVSALWHAADTNYCRIDQAALAGVNSGMPWMKTGVVDYADGLEAIPRHPLPGYDTGVMSLIIVTFLILAANFRHFKSYFKSVWNDLFSVRTRPNAFDDHTVGEERVLWSLLILLCVCEGIIAYSALSTMEIATGNAFLTIGLLSVGAMCLYLFQLGCYQMVGYTFTTSVGRTQWVRGFNASQAMLGLALAVPALLSLFNPDFSGVLAIIGASLYIVARILFIIKGFRIFYDKIFSLFYFILYLCSLEIIPLLACGRGAFFLCYLLDK